MPQKLKILVVEDDKNVLTTVSDLLEESGYIVIGASSGTEGVEKATNEKPDVILMDTNLPDVNGFEVCRLIKGVKGLSAKVVMYTGNIDAVDAVKAKRMGADDYCVKTTDFRLLLKTIKAFERGIDDSSSG